MQISFRFAALAAAAAVLNLMGWAQASRTVNGEWKGTIKGPKEAGDIAIVVDLAKNSKGEWIGTFGMPELGATGLPLDKLVVREPNISFAFPGVPGAPSFDGTLSADGQLSGTFITGTSKTPLSLKRTGQAKVALPTANSKLAKGFEGAWWGSYDAGGPNRYHLVLKFSRLPDGAATGTFTNIDGGNVETPITSIDQVGSYLTFEVRALAASFRGSLNAAGTNIAGEWKQGANTTPLTFGRGASINAINSVLPKPLEGNWESTLDADTTEGKLEFVLKLGHIADGTATGTLLNKDPNSKTLPLSVILVKGNTIQFDVGLIKGKFHGTWNALGNALAGTWEMEEIMTVPMTFKRPVSASKK